MRMPKSGCGKQFTRQEINLRTFWKETGMAIDRRELLQWMGGACSALALSRFATAQAAQGAKFLGTRQSLQGYRIPEWFRDAKFGIWSHWGPQSAIEQGDWYARTMYRSEERRVG